MSIEEYSMGIGPFAHQDIDGVSNSLDLWGKNIRDVSLQNCWEYTFYPTTTDSAGPYFFTIPAEPQRYLDLSSFRISGKVKIQQQHATDGSWGPLASTKLSICNLLPASLFRSAEMNMNGKVVTFISTPMIGMKTYMEKICSFSSEAAKTHLYCDRFEMDTPKKWTMATAADDVNAGINKRKQWIAGSKWMDFNMQPHIDLCHVGKLLPDKVDLTLTMIRNEDSYSLISVPAETALKFRIVIEDLALSMRKNEISPVILNDNNARFARGQLAKYPLTRNILRTKSLSSGDSYARLDNVFAGVLPNLLLMGIVTTDSYVGKRESNPYEFKNCNMKEVYVLFNGRSIPANPLKVDFAEDGEQIANAYRHFHDNLNLQGNQGSIITPELFKHGCTLFSFDFSVDRCSGAHVHPQESGSITVCLKFAEALDKAYTVVFYASYDDVLTIDGDRQVQFESSTTNI